MNDQSHLDLKYFIDRNTYNCPFCNRRHVAYSYYDRTRFHWSNSKACAAWFVVCDGCKKVSMHLTYENLYEQYGTNNLKASADLDEVFFHSQPSSFFTVDSRIPAVLRELIAEAEDCRKMNFLTGASACARKTIYELLVIEEADGENYDDKIDSLAAKYPSVDSELFDVLAHIKDMTSDKVHEQSWDKWDSKNLKLILETLKAILHEMYVVPAEREERKKRIRDLKAEHGGANIRRDRPLLLEKTEDANIRELMSTTDGTASD